MRPMWHRPAPFTRSRRGLSRPTSRTETNGTAIQVSRIIELLTDLPLPPRGKHRIGYYAVWGDYNSEGSTIGYLDDLTAEGGVIAVTNSPPSVSISSPAGGATFTEPA